MKKLEMEQMEEINGGWSWGDCLSGAVAGGSLAYQTGAAFIGGGWGLVGMMAAGCVIGGLS